jgi:hypothetical protein
MPGQALSEAPRGINEATGRPKVFAVGTGVVDITAHFLHVRRDHLEDRLPKSITVREIGEKEAVDRTTFQTAIDELRDRGATFSVCRRKRVKYRTQIGRTPPT